MNVICLYWDGDFRGRDFGPRDVRRLYESVSKHMDTEFDFYVLTNDMGSWMPGTKIPLVHNWPGWWSKMELHRPDLPEGRTLYLDLDSHVIRSLQPIVDYDGNLVMFPSRMRVPKSGRTKEGFRIVDRYQAATMLFTPGSTVGFYNRFVKHATWYMQKFRSEQDLMGRFLPNQPTFPKEWMVKLKEVLKTSKPPDKAIIVTGQPTGRMFRKTPRLVPWLEKMARGKEEDVRSDVLLGG